MRNLLDMAASEPWLITEDGLRQVLAIADRRDLDMAAVERIVAAREMSPEAIAMRAGERLKGASNVSVRDGVAVLPITGPIMRYASLFSSISGATSVSGIASGLQAALDSADVQSILLNYDTPGGQANGIAELAGQIMDARRTKPITAYVGDRAASAGYWLAVSAPEVVLSTTALVGSIGAVMSFTDTSQSDAREGIREVTIVSTQSPMKAMDPATRSGEEAIRAVLDALAEEFIGHVATARGVTPMVVAKDFGRGGIIPRPADAVRLGMADRIGSFEQTLRGMVAAHARKPTPRSVAAALPPVEPSTSGSPALTEEHPMPDTNVAAMSVAEITATNPAVAEAIAAARTEGVHAGAAESATAERARCKAILTAPGAAKQPATAQHLAFASDMSADAATAMLDTVVAGQPAPAPAAAAGFHGRMSEAASPNVGPDAGPGAGAGPDMETPEGVAAFIMNAGKPRTNAKH